VVLGTGVHLLYLAGRYRTLKRLRLLLAFELGEAVGTGAFVCVGLAGLVTSGAFLANVLPLGSFGTLRSGGTVGPLSVAVGIEVASAVVVLLAKFLEQLVELAEEPW
jgi:multicomponent Na+:H+ antiporter subunit B